MSAITAFDISATTFWDISYYFPVNFTCTDFVTYNTDYASNANEFNRAAVWDDSKNKTYVPLYGISKLEFRGTINAPQHNNELMNTYVGHILDSKNAPYLNMAKCQKPQIVYSDTNCNSKMMQVTWNALVNRTNIYCPQNYFLYYWVPVTGPAPALKMGYKYQCCPPMVDTPVSSYPVNTNAGQILLGDNLQPSLLN
jgi:hypothetical protein